MPLPKIALLSAAASFALATPAFAQMNMNMPGMHMPGMKMPPPKKTAPAKKPAAGKRSSSKPSASKKSPSKASPRNKASTAKKAARKSPSKSDGHDMGAMPGMNKPAGHDMSNMPGMTAPSGQAPAGHDMSNMPGMQMPSGQSMSSMPGMQMPPGQPMSNMPAMAAPSGTDLPAGNSPPPPLPTDHAADRVYDPAAMAMGRHHLGTFHGNQKLFQLINNIMEYQGRKGRDGYEWDSQAWYGGDINRLWLKSEGDGAFGKSLERAEVQALYSHALDPYFNLQAGVRYDFKPNPSRVYATVGIEGLAPSFFEVEGALFLSNKGEVMARGEAWYDQRITQRLILQPRTEFNLAAQNSRDIGVGAGLSDAEIGVRLRYDISRQFAPYVGVQYRRAFGRTRDYLRAQGEDPGGWSFLAGLHTWF